MHAGGGTNYRGEKRNVLIVSVLLLIGGNLYAAQQYASAHPLANPEGATGTRSAALARGWTTQTCHGVCVFITAGPITKLFAGGRRRVEDMCYERRRAEACVDESAHHALPVELVLVLVC